MSEIQRSGAAATAAGSAQTVPSTPATATSPASASAPASAPATDAASPGAEVDSQTGATRQTADRARSSQERVARLQQERAQIREQGQQLRAERQEARQEARAEQRAERRASRQAARASRNNAQEVGTGTAQAPATTTPQAPAPEAQAPAAPAAETEPAEEQTRATGITITGTVRQTTGEVREDDAAFGQSAVARERGVTGVAIDDPGDGATFRFEEAGDGLVRATRFEVIDGEQVATGSQTLSVTSVGGDRGAAPGALNFDDIGLELELDEEFTPGDLQFVEISSGTSTASEAAAGTLADPVAAEPTAGESTSDEALRQLEAREQQINISLSEEQSALLGLIERLGVSEIAADERDEALRAISDSFAVVQNSPPAARVEQLLS